MCLLKNVGLYSVDVVGALIKYTCYFSSNLSLSHLLPLRLQVFGRKLYSLMIICDPIQFFEEESLLVVLCTCHSEYWKILASYSLTDTSFTVSQRSRQLQIKYSDIMSNSQVTTTVTTDCKNWLCSLLAYTLIHTYRIYIDKIVSTVQQST